MPIIKSLSRFLQLRTSPVKLRKSPLIDNPLEDFLLIYRRVVAPFRKRNLQFVSSIQVAQPTQDQGEKSCSPPTGSHLGILGAMQFVIPGCKVDPPLRVAGLRINLTYAALFPGELDFDSLLAACRAWGATRSGLREYAMGREKHTQPADPERDEHFHIYLEYGKVIDVSNRLTTTIFNLSGRAGGRVLHPELQQVGRAASDRQRVINYNIKDGDYISELHTALAEDQLRDAADEAS